MKDDKTRIRVDPGRVTVGTQLSGIYELDEHLASGGMGEVYRGHNIQTGDLVAIKIVLPELARDQTILQLFRKEASILNHLSHDAIVRYHVFTIDPVLGRPYLAMEFVDGMSLSGVIRLGPMAFADLGRLGVRLASALAAVHEQNVFHRDLSPDNVILPDGRAERAKIIDFGIARSVKMGDKTLIDGRFAGKHNYVSPEQLGLYGGEVSEQSDIYSLALVLAAASRGKPLDMSGSQWEVLEKRRVVPDLSDMDARIGGVLEAMLQPDPSDRPASMRDVVEMIAAGLPGATMQAEPPLRSPSPRPAARPPTHRHPPLQDEAQGRGRGFVQPVRPAWPGQSRARRTLTAVSKITGPASWPSRRWGWLVFAASLGLLVVAVAGVYSSGILAPPSRAPVTPTRIPQPPPLSASNPQPPAAPPVSVDPPPAAELSIAIPPPPVERLDAVARHIDWLQSYSGGDCFYAVASSATDNAMEIEGFGTQVEPFREMLDAFRSRFGMEPQVGVRLIEPAQCPVTGFLRGFGARRAGMPDLALDRTSIASGSSVSGVVEAAQQDNVNLLLVDHKGMTFSLNGRLTRQGARATFSVPIGLSATDSPGSDGVPQVIIAIAARDPIEAAMLTKPAAASQVLPAIMAEMARKSISGAASAKYFRLTR